MFDHLSVGVRDLSAARPVYDAFFAPLEDGLHLLPGIDVEGFVSEVFTRAPRAAVITPDYEEPICVPPNDARGAVLTAS